MPAGRSRHAPLAAAVLAASLLVAGCGSGDSGPIAQQDARSSAPATGTSQPPASSAPRTYFAQYGASTHAYKPRRLNPSADGSLYVRRVHWRVWDEHRAVGHGIAHVNDCVPDCADGHYTTYPVTIRLAQPRELCGSRFFLGFSLRGPGYRTSAHWSGVGCM